MAREPWEAKARQREHGGTAPGRANTSGSPTRSDGERGALKQGARPGSPTRTGGERSREATAAAVGLKASTYERGAWWGRP